MGKFTLTMKTSRKIFWVSGISCGVAASLLVLTGVLVWETVSLRKHLARTQHHHQTNVAELARLQAQQDLAQTRLSEQRALIENLQTELKGWRDRQNTNPPSPERSRVRVYAGGRYVGTGWISTTNARLAEATVHLDSPAEAVRNDSAPRAAAAVTAFSVAYHYPVWPWFWTWGWLVDGATNGVPAAGSQEMAPNAPATPPVNPVPPPKNMFSVRTAKTTGTLARPGGVWRTVPKAGQPRIEMPTPAPLPPLLTTGQRRAPVSARPGQAVRPTGRPLATPSDRPILQR